MTQWYRLAGKIAVLGTIAAMAVPQAQAVGKVKKAADFNGDGYADLAIGAPSERYSNALGTHDAAGVVHVIFGGPGGLANRPNVVLSRQNRPATHPFRAQSYQTYGDALAWGDFNGDGYDDLAIGAPGVNQAASGSVEVWFGSASGFGADANQHMIWEYFPQRVGATPYNFGRALAAGDVDGDGKAELAISQRWSFDNGRVRNDGGVYVIPGSSTGLRVINSQLLYYQMSGPTALAFGDFNGDGKADLAMGYPYEGQYGGANVPYYYGLVLVGYGTPYGIDSNPQVWDQDTPGIPDQRETYDAFGYALAAADFNDDGRADLAIGTPGENDDAGAVHVLFGSTTGLTVTGNQLLTQNDSRISDFSEADDRFGEALAAGHLQRESNGISSLLIHRLPELVIGAPGEDNATGAVHIFKIATGTQVNFFTQDTGGILEQREAEDQFGAFLTTGDFNRNGDADIAIGVPYENGASGVVQVIFSISSGPTATGNQIFQQGYQGLAETAEAGDRFGTL